MCHPVLLRDCQSLCSGCACWWGLFVSNDAVSKLWCGPSCKLCKHGIKGCAESWWSPSSTRGLYLSIWQAYFAKEISWHSRTLCHQLWELLHFYMWPTCRCHVTNMPLQWTTLLHLPHNKLHIVAHGHDLTLAVWLVGYVYHWSASLNRLETPQRWADCATNTAITWSVLNLHEWIQTTIASCLPASGFVEKLRQICTDKPDLYLDEAGIQSW